MRGLLRLLARCDGSEAEAVVRAVRAAAEADFLLVADSIERLEDADVPTRLVLVQFLGLLRSPATVPPLLRQAREKALAEVVFDTLAELGDAAELGLDTAWSTLDAVAKRDACEVLGRTAGERGVQRLLSALEDDDPEVRVAAAASIGRRRASAALPVLIRHLEAVASRVGAGHEEAGVLARAIASVAEPRAGAEDVNREAVGLLHGVLDGAGDELRFAVAGILGCIGRPEDTELVTLLLKDPSAGVRRAAIDALARLEPGTAAESLRLAVADESPRVRVAAACALGASESDAVIEDLARLAEDDDRWVRAAAARALGIHFARATADEPRRLALEVLERALEDDALVALGAVEALAGVGGPPALRVAELLGRPEPELVQEAIACLGHHADSDALAALLPLVAHPEWSVRAAAIDVLAARGVKRAVPTMLRRLESEEDEHVRQVLLRALERLEAE